MWHADISINIYFVICRLELSTNDESAQQLLANNLYHNSSAASLLPNHGSMIHNSHYPYRQFSVQQPSPLIGSLNLSSSSTPPTNSSSPPNRPATLTLAANTANSVSSTNQIHQNNSNNLYSNNNNSNNNNNINNHLYHHNNLTTSSSSGCSIGGGGGINNSVHNTRLNLLPSTTTSSSTKHSGILSSLSSSSSTIHQHHPTPLDGLAALSALGNSSLHLSNSISGSSSNSLGTPDLGMTHWLSDPTSNAGKFEYLSVYHHSFNEFIL